MKAALSMRRSGWIFMTASLHLTQVGRRRVSQSNSTSAYTSDRGNSTFKAGTRTVDPAPLRTLGPNVNAPASRVHIHAFGSSWDRTREPNTLGRRKYSGALSPRSTAAVEGD